MSSSRVYDVFTRIKRGDDLVLVGSVEAESDDLARVYASMTYNEENWVEMRLAPRDQIILVKSVEGLFAGKEENNGYLFRRTSSFCRVN
jgi:hypothetical protein